MRIDTFIHIIATETRMNLSDGWYQHTWISTAWFR